MTRELRRVAVIGGVRIPFCRSNTRYADLSNLDMMGASLNGLVDKFGLKGQHIDEVVDIDRLGYDVGCANRIFEEVFEAAHSGRAEQDGARQGSCIQGTIACGTGAAAAGRFRAAHGPVDGTALRANGAAVENLACRAGRTRL